MQILAVLGWLLGMSYRGAVPMFKALGISLERMSVWRDVQAEATQLQKRREWGKVHVLGLDRAYVRGWGEVRPVLVAIDLGNGQPVMIGQVDEYDPLAVRKWLEPLVQSLGIGVIVTDDLMSYRQVAKHLNLEHQVCQFHLRRRFGRTLYQLQESLPEEWRWVIREVKQLIDKLPAEVDH